MVKYGILALAFAAAATPADAATAYLSRTGTGSSCTQASPCSSMNAAIAATGAGGTVICLDRGVYSDASLVNINGSIAIFCGEGLWQGAQTQIRINPPSGSSVLIEGFVTEGLNNSVAGIEFTGQGTLSL